MKCYISSSSSSKQTLSDVVSELKNLGFKRIELTGNINYSEGMEDLILKFKNSYNLDFIIHNYLPIQPEDFVINLASTNHDTHNKSLSLIKKAILLSKKLGKDLYSIHPGFKYDLIPKLNNGFFIKSNKNCNNREDYYQTLKYISQYIILENFRIAVENLSPESSNEIYSFLCTPDDIYDFFNYFNDRPNVGILLDFGHLNVASKLLNFDKFEVLDKLFNKYLNRIFEIHISENDGSKDFHNVSELDSWQIEYLLNYRKFLKDMPIIFEWRNSSSKKTFKRYEMIRNKLEN